MNLLRALIAVVCAAGAALPARAYDDMVSGFGIDPPSPFEVTDATPGPTALRIGIGSTTGEPPIAGNGKYVCELSYETSDINAALTQEQINEATQSMWRREQVTSSIDAQMSIDNVAYFSIDDVRGMELVLTPKVGPDAANVRLVLSLAETPKARFVQSCATSAAALEAALPQFRAIRNTARLP
jgi:hypothetical protein